MKKEELIMQLLAGVITESQYKQKLDEVSKIETIQSEWMILTTEVIDLVNEWKSGNWKIEPQIHAKYKEVEKIQKNFKNTLADGHREIENLLNFDMVRTV